MLRFFEAHRSCKWGAVRIYCGIFSTESARATLVQRGDASRGSSTESARATLLQRGDASRGSSTEPAKGDLAAEKEDMISGEARDKKTGTWVVDVCATKARIQSSQLSKKIESLAQGGFCSFSLTAVPQKIATSGKRTKTIRCSPAPPGC